MQQLHGQNLIGSQCSGQGETLIPQFYPREGRPGPTQFHQATTGEIDRAMLLASEGYAILRRTSSANIARLLETIAAEIEVLGDDLLEQAQLESGLTKERLTGERARTVGQLRLFARVVEEGSFVDARIDTPLPERKPIPRPDLRRMLIPIGPVVIFGASNFPLAFSVAGGDTASALAARNPVVVKAHPSHPGTSELVAGAISRAVLKLGLPEGTFSLLHGSDPSVSIQLVEHPATKAVGFTGSERAGRAIWNAAAQRPEPIPAYVEMGSNNPVFLLPGALEASWESIAKGLWSSINMGVGQMCTSPGVVFGQRSEPLARFTDSISSLFTNGAPETMLSPGIAHAYRSGLESRTKTAGVQAVESTQKTDGAKTQELPALFKTSADVWLQNPSLAEELFGPSAVLVQSESHEQLLQIAKGWHGTLTAAVFGTEQDLAEYADLIDVLREKTGRLIFNGYPTGVEVSYAMHHGGPYPATGDAKWTSVGTAAILRFLRPVCYQNFPDAALPPELQGANPKNIWRTVDGELTQNPLPL